MINHLGHTFETLDKSTINVGLNNNCYFKCKNCKIIVYSRVTYSDKYFISDLWTKKLYVTEMLNLTCDDVIIKQIIE